MILRSAKERVRVRVRERVRVRVRVRVSVRVRVRVRVMGMCTAPSFPGIVSQPHLSLTVMKPVRVKGKG